MKAMLWNKKIFTITSIFLVLVIAAGGFWQYYNSVSVEASGLVSININQGSISEPGKEMLSGRTENSKQYYLGPDSYALDVTIGAIHYKDYYADKNEQWKDIDLTFENGRITKAPYILSVDQANKSLTVQDKKSGQVTTLALAKIGDQTAKDIEKKSVILSEGKIQWEDVATDLDLAITAENTRVRFDWIVKSEKAPHEVEFEIKDGGIPITYQGADADGNNVEVAATRTGNRVTERIEKGGQYPKLINPIIDVNTGASENDSLVRWDGSSWQFRTNANGVTVGTNMSTYERQGSGLRFPNITIPANSTISSSYLSFYCLNNGPGNTARCKITGDKENNPAAWSTIEDYQTRRGTVVGGANNSNITTAQVYWDNIVAWYSSNWYNSPDISSVVQELINAHAPNNEALALFWDDHDNRCSSNVYRTGVSFDYGGTAYGPKLHLEYTIPSSISNTPSNYNLGGVGPSTTISSGLTYFNVTNNSASTVNITIGGTDLTGGTTWTLSDNATAGTSIAGLKAGLSGGSYNVVVKKTAPFNTLKSGLGAGASQQWGFQLLAPTNYTDAVQKTGTITLTATAP